jgi:hypothetical protein
MILYPCKHRGHPHYSYVSNNVSWAYAEYQRPYRSNALELDKLMIACMTDFLCDRAKLRKALKGLGLFGAELDKLTARGASAARHLANAPAEMMHDLFEALFTGIEIGEDEVSLSFRSIELRRFLSWSGQTAFRGRPSDWSTSDARYVLEVAVSAISAHRWSLVHIGPRDATSSVVPDSKLIALLHKARRAQRLVEENRDWSVDELASEMNCRPGHFSRLIRLNYLAPDIVTAIVDGMQPAGLTRDSLLKAHVPLDWALQRKLLGFPADRRSRRPSSLFGRGLWPGPDTKPTREPLGDHRANPD